MSPAELAFEECRVDLAEKAALPTPPMSPSVPAVPPPPSAPPEASRVLQPEVLPPERSTASSATDNDFLADMQSILMGQRVFDPAAKKTVDKAEALRTARTRPLPDAEERAGDLRPHRPEHAVRERVRPGQHRPREPVRGLRRDIGPAGARRRGAEGRRSGARRKWCRGNDGSAGAATKSSCATWTRFAPRRSRSHSSTPDGRYSGRCSPRASTCEPAAICYPEQFRVGKAPGVMFSYGQIIAMADLFDTVTDMMDADPAELQSSEVADRAGHVALHDWFGGQE